MAAPKQQIRHPRRLQSKPSNIDSHHCYCNVDFYRCWCCCCRCRWCCCYPYYSMMHSRIGHWHRYWQSTATLLTSQHMHSNRVTFRSQSMWLSLSMPQMLSLAERLHSLHSAVQLIETYLVYCQEGIVYAPLVSELAATANSQCQSFDWYDVKCFLERKWASASPRALTLSTETQSKIRKEQAPPLSRRRFSSFSYY